MKLNKICVLLIGVLFLILLEGNVQAALVANGKSPTTKTGGEWLTGIRKMQEIGGSLGLQDRINDDLTSNNVNLDIHMEKNSEYGAMVILSASSFGKTGKIQSGQTTTGNESGVVININGEFVAQGGGGSWNSYSGNYKDRYRYIYSTALEKLPGDAMDIASWHGGTVSYAFPGWPSGANLKRAYSGSAFSAYSVCWDTRYSQPTGYSRAAIVLGTGI